MKTAKQMFTKQNKTAGDITNEIIAIITKIL